MSPFQAALYDGEPVPAPKPKPKLLDKPKPNWDEARGLYAAFMIKRAQLEECQKYAEMIAKATDGPSMTPVRPLATMGNNGGPLLCDHCLMPIILEGGVFHKMHADDAWKKAPASLKEGRWLSYISGGLVVRIVENGTLRIYHGYDGRPDHCCTKAQREQDEREKVFVRDTSKLTMMHRYFTDEFPDEDANKKLTEYASIMCSFDPGLGYNRPEVCRASNG